MQHDPADYCLGVLQAAKAEALGPRHNIGGLDAVLAEPWRSQVAADAARAEEAGWFWRYRTNSLKARAALQSNMKDSWL